VGEKINNHMTVTPVLIMTEKQTNEGTLNADNILTTTVSQT
jgi:hypothetical protein